MLSKVTIIALKTKFNISPEMNRNYNVVSTIITHFQLELLINITATISKQLGQVSCLNKPVFQGKANQTTSLQVGNHSATKSKCDIEYQN